MSNNSIASPPDLGATFERYWRGSIHRMAISAKTVREVVAGRFWPAVLAAILAPVVADG